ncbi:ribosome silencing factor [Ottowia sp.]|uniref:ribosome silencing factor n=1 Tax=Ottowia sp. TaxID=1898956 RepID=UPI0039E68806
MSETAAKKDVQKLQRAIVDGLEDVKAQDIRVFNTEHLSPLFERVIVASGTSNRQTKALASSVRDKVRAGGFPKPRIEGEDNGEWIIVDCGAAVAHIMQPAIRQYYNLEEIWGEKPVRLRSAAPEIKKKTAPAPASQAPAATKKVASRKAPASTAADGKAAAKPAPAKRAPAKKAPAKKSAPRKTAARKAAPQKVLTVNKPAPAKKAGPRQAGPARKAAPRQAAPRKAR